MAVLAVEPPVVPVEPDEAHDGRAEATRTTDELFQWSTYVHVGAGAPECPGGENGECRDPEHFHAWLRLPNAWQVRDIQEKAEAARARRRRALKDPESDARVTLEDHLDAWSENDEAWEALLVRVANRAVLRIQDDIRRELLDSEEYKHYFADLEELQRLNTVAEGDRDAEEYTRLSEHVEKFVELFNERSLAEHEKEMFRLRALSRDEVLKMERNERINELADERFLNTFYQWAYYVCVLKPAPKPKFPATRVFESFDALKAAPPEVTDALRDAYRKLESRTVARGDVAGNS